MGCVIRLLLEIVSLACAQNSHDNEKPCKSFACWEEMGNNGVTVHQKLTICSIGMHVSVCNHQMHAHTDSQKSELDLKINVWLIWLSQTAYTTTEIPWSLQMWEVYCTKWIAFDYNVCIGLDKSHV